MSLNPSRGFGLSGRAIAVLVGVSVTPAFAVAQPSTLPMLVVGDPAVGQAAADTIDALVRASGFSTEVELRERLDLGEILIPPEPPPRARIFLDLSEPHRAVLVIADDRRSRMSIRVLDRMPGGDDVLIEELAQIIDVSLGIIASGASFGQARTDAIAELQRIRGEPTAPEPAAEQEPAERRPAERPTPAPQETSGAIDVSALAAYRFEFHGPDAALAHGPWLEFEARLTDVSVPLSFGLGAGYRRAPSFESDAIEGRIDAALVRGRVSAAARVGDWWLSLHFTGGVDVTVPRLTVQIPLEDSSEVRIRPVIGAGLRLELPLLPDLALYADVGAEVALARVSYEVAQSDGTQTSVFQPWWVRPLFQLGIRAF
ncbi:MAG: hypothetical protein AAGF12_06140 [Myxococcota bacterium]